MSRQKENRGEKDSLGYFNLECPSRDVIHKLDYCVTLIELFDLVYGQLHVRRSISQRVNDNNIFKRNKQRSKESHFLPTCGTNCADLCLKVKPSKNISVRDSLRGTGSPKIMESWGGGFCDGTLATQSTSGEQTCGNSYQEKGDSKPSGCNPFRQMR